MDLICSPDVLLASTFSKENHPHLILLTGESGSGKTHWCLKLIERAKTLPITVCGLVSPPIYVGNQKVGIELVNLDSGEHRLLAVLRNQNTLRVHHGPQTEDWQFDDETLAWGNRVLDEISHSHQDKPHLLILDELGPLEFLEGKGFQSALRLVDERRYTLACVVVRPRLLHLAQQRWTWGQTLTLPNPNPTGGRY